MKINPLTDTMKVTLQSELFQTDEKMSYKEYTYSF